MDAAFHQIYQSELTYVWHCLRRLGIDQRDLEDTVQEVFLVLLRRFKDFDQQRPVRPYLAGIAVRVASDYRRRPRYRKEVVRAEVERPDAASGPEDALAQKQARQLMHQLLETLDHDQRVVFVLHELQELSMPQIAEMVEAPLSTCYSRLRLAREGFARTARRLRQQRGER